MFSKAVTHLVGEMQGIYLCASSNSVTVSHLVREIPSLFWRLTIHSVREMHCLLMGIKHGIVEDR